MKNGKLLLFAMFFVLSLVLCGCSDAYALSFDEDVYYVKEGETIAPSVRIKPAKADYSIVVENTSVASTEDGKTLLGLKNGSQTLITAKSGKRTAQATLVVSDKTDRSTIDYSVRKTHYVTFVMANYALVGLSEETLRVVPYLDGDVVGEALPIYTGYRVTGWYYDRTHTKQFLPFDDPIKSDLTLYCYAEMLDNPFSFNGLREVSGIRYPNLPHDELIFPEKTNTGETVVGIADNAFCGDALLKKAVIPASYVRIGAHAFSGCVNLVDVTLSEGSALREIGNFAFSVYSSVDDVSTVVDEACGRLQTLALPDSVETIGDFAFYGCSSYAPTVPAALTKLSYGVFYGTKIAAADLSRVTEIGAYAFANCASLTSVTNAQDVEVCEANAFVGSALYTRQINRTPYVAYADSILLAANNQTFGKLNLGRLRLAETVTLIADGAFNGYNQTEITVYFPRAGVRIGDDAFLDAIGVCLVVPDDALASYKEDNPYYDERFCTEVTIRVDEDENAVNFGLHTLLKYSETDYRYDQFTVLQNAEGLYRSPTEISFSALGETGRFITRINVRAINLGEGGGRLQTLRLGNLSSAAYMSVINCKKLASIDLTGAHSVVSIEQGSFQFTTLDPDCRVYVNASDMTAYQTKWASAGVALERLTAAE